MHAGKPYGLFYYTCMTMIVSGCLEPYAPPDASTAVDILVVEGFLDQGRSSASVRLTRAVALASTEKPTPEVNAKVTIEESDGPTITLTADTIAGSYIANDLTINPGKPYRLHITTRQGSEYLSDYENVYHTPDIDSVTWHGTAAGTTVYASTHDATGNARYYLWDYVETYEYRSAYAPGYQIQKGEIVQLHEDEYVNRCWATKSATSILLHSTKNLGVDAMLDYPLVFMPLRSIKLSIRYSILVKLKVVSEQHYAFWQQLKNTTENIGGLFDPMPSQVVGNVHNIRDAREPVLGYFGAGELREKRIFIKHDELPEELQRVTPKPQGCEIDTVLLGLIKALPDNTFLIYPVGGNGPGTAGGYTTAMPICMDCRVQGGVTKRPDFWD
ncbi:MAG TPA: DUF4249 domain-containing protein [Chryseolinea sp.]